MDKLNMDIQYMKGVGPKRKALLNHLGVETVFDLLWTIPRAYFDRSRLDRIADLKNGDIANVRGVVTLTRSNRSRNGINLFRAAIQDRSGQVTGIWFNQPYLAGLIKPGKQLFVSGKIRGDYGNKEIQVNEYEILDEEDMNHRVLPIYPLSEGLNQKTMRRLVLGALDNFLEYYPDCFNASIREQYQLCPIDYALRNIHFPENGPAYLRARKRLVFEELALFQISLKLEKEYHAIQSGYLVHKEKSNLVEQVRRQLEFDLTSDQQMVLSEIFSDMEKARPMNRLLQGDVGSGKTVVAAIAMAKAVASGFQAAIMAPTEILAEQHLSALQHFFAGTGVSIACLSSSTPPAVRKSILEAIRDGSIDLLAGTHALIQNEVVFQRLGLVIIDEQHRFGVKQRAMLGEKGEMADVLVMSATPIPRTLALTAYGDLDLSVIKHLPPGRKPVKTINIERNQRLRVYKFIRQETRKGTQAYVVCPLVEESEKQDLLAAQQLYEELKENILADIEVGLIHGRMKAADKESIMSRFKSGAIKVLVSTTVIEVGVDVPNATIMVVEHAERFGLSQLHQLRGRVGRGSRQSYCLLVGEPRTEEAVARLKAMERSNDGFRLAQEDLQIRGPGDFWGVKQHGLERLKVASLLKDGDMIELTRDFVNQYYDVEGGGQLQSYINQKFKKESSIAGN